MSSDLYTWAFLSGFVWSALAFLYIPFPWNQGAPPHPLARWSALMGDVYIECACYRDYLGMTALFLVAYIMLSMLLGLFACVGVVALWALTLVAWYLPVVAALTFIVVFLWAYVASLKYGGRS